MAKITLTGGFSVIPEGTQVFKIVDVSYKEEYGKIEVKMQTAKGQYHTERFTLMKKDGSVNEGAINAFSFFAKTALQNYSLDVIDHQDIIGRFIRCTVVHDKQPSTKDPEKTVTFIHLGDKSPADGFEGEETLAIKAPGNYSLDDLLG